MQGKHGKLQSAMEYLMTYGWAVLLIGVILGALFELGLFNPTSFSAKATPGSCSIYRPNGPGTTQFIKKQGICNNEIPQYVAVKKGSSGAAVSSYISVAPSTSNISKIQNAVTVSAWVNIDPSFLSNVYNYVFSNSRDCCGFYNGFDLYVATGNPVFDIWNTNKYAYTSSVKLSSNTWYMLAGTFDGSLIKVYINGNYIGSAAYSGSIGVPSSYGSYLGAMGAGPTAYEFGGKLSNVQVYDTSLSANEIKSLYVAGIGAAPIDIQHIMGWWPLNGNANDYSGNNYDGVPNGISYTSNWESGYNIP